MNNVRIHRQNRRSMVMKRTPVGLVVFIPRWLKPDSPQVRRFIADGIAKLGAPATSVEQTTAADLRALVAAWAQRLNVQPGRVQVRDMYQKWGSCSSKGSITLNTALCNIAPPLAEYVVLHEVVHLRVFNHGKDFKALMSVHMPDWQERERALDALLRSKNTLD